MEQSEAKIDDFVGAALPGESKLPQHWPVTIAWFFLFPTRQVISMNNTFKKTVIASAITLGLAGCNNDSDSTSQDQPAASPLQVSLEKDTVTRYGKIKTLKATVSLTNSANIASQVVMFKTSNKESVMPHSCTLSSEKPSCTVNIHPHQVARTTTFEAITIKTTFKDGQAQTMAQANAGNAPKATTQLDGETSLVANPVSHGGSAIYLAPPILNSTGQVIQAFYIHNWADSSGNWIYGGPVGYTNGKIMNWQNGVEIAHSYGEWYDPNTVDAQDLSSLNWNANGYLGGTYFADSQTAYNGETTKWTIALLINGTCYTRVDDAREADKQNNDNLQGWGPVAQELVGLENELHIQLTLGNYQTGFWGEFTNNSDGTDFAQPPVRF